MRDVEPLFSALRERLPPDVSTSLALPTEIALAELQLGFPLPPLLRQIYGIANGGLGPGFGLLRIGEGQDTLAAVYRSFADSSFAPRPGEPGSTSIRGPTACCRSATGDARSGRASTVAPMTARSSRPRTATLSRTRVTRWGRGSRRGSPASSCSRKCSSQDRREPASTRSRSNRS